jgi:hypothetical protein
MGILGQSQYPELVQAQPSQSSRPSRKFAQPRAEQPLPLIHSGISKHLTTPAQALNLGGVNSSRLEDRGQIASSIAAEIIPGRPTTGLRGTQKTSAAISQHESVEQKKRS